MEPLKIVSISFHCAGKLFDFEAKDLNLIPGDRVVVETERGRALGTVITKPREIAPADAPPKLKAVLRIATENDLQMAGGNAQREQEALRFCQKKVQERKLDMKLVRAEYLFDGSKIIFYFTADGRIDFRELVRDLAQHYRTRIEMRQIGVRDEAKLVGGLGICGRELCCATHLREFAPVSVKMAKAQGLALNPSKISGQCGRLLCCLAYEYETYNDLKKNLPKCGKKLQLKDGKAEVIALDILAQKVTLSCHDGERCTMHIDELKKAAETDQQASGDEPRDKGSSGHQGQKAAEQETPPAKRGGRNQKRPPRPPRRQGQEEKTPPVKAVDQKSNAKQASPDKQPENKQPADKPARRRRRPRRRSGKPRNPDTDKQS